MNIFRYVICILMVCCFPAVQARLEIKLTRAVDAALPIAVVPFDGDLTLPTSAMTITQVIQNDLKNSGQFRVIDPGVLDQQPHFSGAVDASAWKHKGANDVLVGRVSKVGLSRYKVSIELVDLYAKDSGASPVLLSQSFQAKAPDLRGLAHHISDAVYEKLTGVKGVFSTKIAYVSVEQTQKRSMTYRLMVADADGFNPRTVLSSSMPIMSPAWSSDGKQLTYVTFEGHQAAVYLQNLSTGKRQLVSRAPGINGAPALSPDGKKMALVLTKTGNPKIYIMDLSTRSLQKITKGFSIDTEPSWSPDSQSLLFTSNRGGTPQIYQYDLASRLIKRLTFDGNYNAKASYLPHRKGIVMMHRGQQMFGIATQNLSTGRVEVLAQSGADESPSVAPNGKMVIYATQYGGRPVLAVVSTDGYVKLRLPAQSGNVQEPAWSPFLT